MTWILYYLKLGWLAAYVVLICVVEGCHYCVRICVKELGLLGAVSYS